MTATDIQSNIPQVVVTATAVSVAAASVPSAALVLLILVLTAIGNMTPIMGHQLTMSS